ncbi:MAG: endonuclease/exonuclease/phosphatase family protein [Lutibacter sp.]|uniref:endonuclease/exonuclease/phosphatase family protein n=1 Tax=Lutibacter sp. TaxID=1925666 RepID=UPI00179E8F67|nr:endonuclease/exonuclease/phosphatase family protein [Lutibacter sp.]MBT8317001.1 endonuclease/exonuclease/phosphatase family protein [Lutibacter sp.]NNJ57861.1 endonuclease/exonuclease/phosphatase family protein [Lutibacter sp.]
MKKLSIIDKLITIANSLVAALLLISFLSYYISPNTFPIFSLLSLVIPFLIVINLLFAFYWIVKLKRQFLISILVLLIGFQHLTKFYSFQEKKVLLNNDLKIMSYNVRMFNVYDWIHEENVPQKIYDFINNKNPDVLCLQEFNNKEELGFSYPYKFIKVNNKGNRFGQAIFSKYSIINTGSLNFSNSSNNAIFADIVKNNDTIRVYNVHLESLKINPEEKAFNKENTEKLKVRLENAFKKQANQATLLVRHQQKTNLKKVICGDFNNNAFSWVYHQLKKGKNDAFEESGKGFGKTYNFNFPLRIDFILADQAININNFKTYNVNYSDHFPIMARLNF